MSQPLPKAKASKPQKSQILFVVDLHSRTVEQNLQLHRKRTIARRDLLGACRTQPLRDKADQLIALQLRPGIRASYRGEKHEDENRSYEHHGGNGFGFDYRDGRGGHVDVRDLRDGHDVGGDFIETVGRRRLR